MFKKMKYLAMTTVMAAVAIVTFGQTLNAQEVYAWTMSNGGKCIEIEMDTSRKNGLWVTVEDDRVSIHLNQVYHGFYIDGNVRNRLRIVDGDYDSGILVAGFTPPGGMDVWIWGYGGDDWIHNQIGHLDGFWGSTIYGGDGNDEIWAGNGSDTVYGGRGNDEIYGGTSRDWIEGGAGNDQLFGEDGDDNLLGGDGVDEIDGGNGNDGLYGNKRLPDRDGVSDILIGGPGADRFYSAFYRWQTAGRFRYKAYAERELLDDFDFGVDAKIETLIPKYKYGFGN